MVLQSKFLPSWIIDKIIRQGYVPEDIVSVETCQDGSDIVCTVWSGFKFIIHDYWDKWSDGNVPTGQPDEIYPPVMPTDIDCGIVAQLYLEFP